MLYALETLECMRRVLLCMLEAAEGELCLLEVLEMPKAMRCVLLWQFPLRNERSITAPSSFKFLVKNKGDPASLSRRENALEVRCRRVDVEV